MLPMQANPIDDWQHLTAHYRDLNDDALLDLAADLNDLTETAQQALRSEIESRGLDHAEAQKTVSPANTPPSNAPSAPGIAHIEREPGPEDPAVPLGYLGSVPEIVPDDEEPDSSSEAPPEYTWKTVLCDCETNEEAQRLAEILRRSGVDSWTQRPMEFGRRYARVLVAADQLDQARAIAARPMPSGIIEESEAKVPDYQPPKCPDCGAPDPVLEGVDPANSWKCEQCGRQWTESVPAGSINMGQPPA